MENLNYKSETIQRKLEATRKGFYVIKRYIIEDRETKIKREIGEIFLNLVMVSKDDMDRFEKKNEVEKIRQIWFH